jgi:hypothetical protein
MMKQHGQQNGVHDPEDDADMGDGYDQASYNSRGQSPVFSHEHARELIREQIHTLLPADEANALADHLLECDTCFKYAQDIAHEERQSGKHNAVGRTDRW